MTAAEYTFNQTTVAKLRLDVVPHETACALRVVWIGAANEVWSSGLQRLHQRRQLTGEQTANTLETVA